jgi:hypothetical protein
MRRQIFPLADQVVVGLKTWPESIGQSDMSRQPQVSVGGDGPLAQDDLLDPPRRRPDRSGDRERQSKEIRRIRRKLGLSQIAAARLTGGGHNAFSRYERGEAMPAVVNLFRLLDKHPELLKDLV